MAPEIEVNKEQIGAVNTWISRNSIHEMKVISGADGAEAHIIHTREIGEPVIFRPLYADGRNVSGHAMTVSQGLLDKMVEGGALRQEEIKPTPWSRR